MHRRRMSGRRVAPGRGSASLAHSVADVVAGSSIIPGDAVPTTSRVITPSCLVIITVVALNHSTRSWFNTPPSYAVIGAGSQDERGHGHTQSNGLSLSTSDFRLLGLHSFLHVECLADRRKLSNAAWTFVLNAKSPAHARCIALSPNAMPNAGRVQNGIKEPFPKAWEPEPPKPLSPLRGSLGHGLTRLRALPASGRVRESFLRSFELEQCYLERKRAWQPVERGFL